MLKKIQEKGSLLMDKAIANSEAVKDVADIISHESNICSVVPDLVKHEKESAFWYNALAAKECKEYTESTQKILETVQQTNAALEAYQKAREAEIAVLKTMLDRYKTTEKLEQKLSSAEKKKAKAKPSEVGTAEAEYKLAKDQADADRVEVNAFGKQNIKQALLFKHKAILDLASESQKQAQIAYNIVNSL